jgi:hypothetical protein
MSKNISQSEYDVRDELEVSDERLERFVSQKERTITLINSVAFILASFVLMGVQFKSLYGTRESLFNEFQSALAGSQIDVLQKNPHFGAEKLITEEIQKWGKVWYQNTRGIFEKSMKLGEETYQSIRGKVFSQGTREYNKLPSKTKKMVGGKPLIEFYIQNAGYVLSPEEMEIISNGEAFFDEEKEKVAIFKLGIGILTEEEKSMIAGMDLSTIESSNDKAVKKLLRNINKEGKNQLDSLFERLSKEGEKALNQLDSSKKKMLRMGRDKWIVEKGIEWLTSEEKAMITDIDALVDEESKAASELKDRLGRSKLTSFEAKEIEGLTYEKFISDRTYLTQKHGTRLFKEFLSNHFKNKPYFIQDENCKRDFFPIIGEKHCLVSLGKTKQEALYLKSVNMVRKEGGWWIENINLYQ